MDKDNEIDEKEWFQMLMPYRRQMQYIRQDIVNNLHKASNNNDEDIQQFVREFKFVEDQNKSVNMGSFGAESNNNSRHKWQPNNERHNPAVSFLNIQDTKFVTPNSNSIKNQIFSMVNNKENNKSFCDSFQKQIHHDFNSSNLYPVDELVGNKNLHDRSGHYKDYHKMPYYDHDEYEKYLLDRSKENSQLHQSQAKSVSQQKEKSHVDHLPENYSPLKNSIAIDNNQIVFDNNMFPKPVNNVWYETENNFKAFSSIHNEEGSK